MNFPVFLRVCVFHTIGAGDKLQLLSNVSIKYYLIIVYLHNEYIIMSANNQNIFGIKIIKS